IAKTALALFGTVTLQVVGGEVAHGRCVAALGALARGVGAGFDAPEQLAGLPACCLGFDPSVDAELEALRAAGRIAILNDEDLAPGWHDAQPEALERVIPQEHLPSRVRCNSRSELLRELCQTDGPLRGAPDKSSGSKLEAGKRETSRNVATLESER